jgi:cation:H+ antiporter
VEAIESDTISSSFPLIVLYFILGSAGLYFGSELLVENAVIIAKEWGVSELVIGVTIIALGTSLPELVTSCLAAVKGHNNISIGNLIGSNIFNVFAVIGITSSCRSINVDESVLYFDFPVMLGITLFLGCILFVSKINRLTGFALLLAYFTYILVSIV